MEKFTGTGAINPTGNFSSLPIGLLREKIRELLARLHNKDLKKLKFAVGGKTLECQNTLSQS